MERAHIVALETKHATLDQRIAAETRRPMPDAVIVSELKKQKLKIKEAITSG
jgi:hypothetical protein